MIPFVLFGSVLTLWLLLNVCECNVFCIFEFGKFVSMHDNILP